MSRYIDLDEAKARTTQLIHGYEVEQWLDTIPSIDIDRPQGEWIWHEDEDICNCSRCDFEIDAEGCIDPIAYVEIYNFCPHCGARMKGADDE
jgi:hypothetical protein